MPTYIGQKLDFLMNLTNTRNSALAKALNFSNSHISRIRSGERGLPQKQPFTQPAGAYFARNLTEPYQQKAAADTICPGRTWPKNQADAAALIASWLEDDSHLSPAPAKRARAEKAGPRCFFGNAGKREAVEFFLSQLCARDKPPALLLHSDEDMTWLTEDGAFARRWGELLSQYLAKGGHIRIVHSVGRSLGEMLEALEKWAPLYMLGEIEPWYCPRVRDGIYHRTLFIARGHSAIVSHSVGAHTEKALNLLLDNVPAVHALEGEFADYLALCKPLMDVYRPGSVQGLRYQLDRFQGSPEELLSGTLPQGGALLAKEGVGAFLLPPVPTGPVFHITEPQMAASVCEYLRRLPHQTPPHEAMATAEAYLTMLKGS